MKGPEGKYFFGLVKIGEKGQIVIPKEARDVFGLKPGDKLLMLGDIKQGLALVDPSVLKLFEKIPGFLQQAEGAGDNGNVEGTNDAAPTLAGDGEGETAHD